MRKLSTEKGKMLLLALDALLLTALAATINLTRFGKSWPDYPLQDYLVGGAAAVSIYITVGYFSQMYEEESRLSPRTWWTRSVKTVALSSLLCAATATLTDRYLMPRLTLIVFTIMAAVVLTVNRKFLRKIRQKRHGNPTVLLVGSEKDRADAKEHIILGSAPVIIAGETKTVNHLMKLTRSMGASDIMLLKETPSVKDINDLIDNGTGVFHAVSAEDTLLGLRRLNQIAGMPFVQIKAHSLNSSEHVLKMIFERLVILVTSIVWVPALIVITVSCAAGTNPVFFIQKRVGKKNKEFTIYKIRTLDDNEQAITKRKWLRNTRLDELPQILNILKGEMSLIGPRAEMIELVAVYEKQIRGYNQRHEIAPGITGLAQVSGHHHTDAEFKLGYDLQYLINWSLVLDVQILVSTAKTMIKGATSRSDTK